jgi:poly-gamma-glutamate synthesis protein (capsule biosynthesis protein)
MMLSAATAIVAGVFATTNLHAQTFVPPPPTKMIRISFLGDIMLDRGVAITLKKTPFETLLKEFRDDAKFDASDLVVANLEGPFSEKRIVTGKALSFRFDPLLAPELKWLGIDAVSLANNHGLDMGRKALTGTRTLLEDNGTMYFGDPWEVNDFSSYITLVQGKRVALVGFNTTFYSITQKQMVEKIEAVRKDADIVIVMMHWGNEYKLKHNDAQALLAHTMIDAGADAVIGSHPHVVEDTEFYKGKPIVYSLGNFIFDQTWSKATQLGIEATITIRDGGAMTLETRGFTSVKGKPTWDKQITR